jgi:hypothetical protein
MKPSKYSLKTWTVASFIGMATIPSRVAELAKAVNRIPAFNSAHHELVGRRVQSASSYPGGLANIDLPPGYAPPGIATIDARDFIVTAMHFVEKPDDATDQGGGYADVFDTKGDLIRRFATIEYAKSRWAIIEYLCVRNSERRPLQAAEESIR